MYRTGKFLATALAVWAVAGVAVADVVQLWTCELNEGSTREQVKAANDRWMAFANTTVKGGGVRSAAGYTMVGDTTEFIFIDEFPSLQAWAAVEDAMASDEAGPIVEALDAAATCEVSRLYRMVKSG